MKKIFSSAIIVATLGILGGSPAFAQFQPKSFSLLAQQQKTAPSIDSFTVAPVNQLSPGTELVFTLQGTPKSRATLTIGNAVYNLPLRETELGYYEGRYTIRNQDRITKNTSVRANLRLNGQVSSMRLQDPLITTSTNSNSNRRSNNNTSTTDQSVVIDRFTVQPVSQLEPGTDLNFTLVGTPNSRATFSIEGVAYNQPMKETSEGNYQGRYVLRRQDDIPSSGTTVTASLKSKGQVVRAHLDQSLLASNSTNASNNPLPLQILSPQNNSSVNGTIEVRGRSAPNATINVNVQAMTSLGGLVGFNQNVFNRSLKADSQGYFTFTFSPTLSIPGTHYKVDLDSTQGNQTNKEILVLIQQ